MQLEKHFTKLALDESSSIDLDFEGQLIPLRFQPGRKNCKTLLIMFHGAVDRETRKVPAFTPFLPELADSVHQLAISDPTMLAGSNFSMSWYAGHESFDSQRILKDIFKKIADFLSVENVIFFGTSGGGFAALYYSWHYCGSVAIVGNPQTKIEKYYSGHVQRYRDECWKSLEKEHPLGELICADVCNLYAERFDNTVIYLQSNSDYFHLFHHMAPFLDAVKVHKKPALISNVGFWGRMGHSPAFSAMHPWVKTVLSAPDLSVETLIKTHDLLTNQSAPVQAPKEKNNLSFSAADISKASLLNDQLLKG